MADQNGQDVMQRQVRVERLFNISGDIYQVILTAADNTPMQWYAGQYLEVVMPTGYPCAYSIASAATDGFSLELHIQCFPGHERAQQVIEHLQQALQQGSEITINIAKGDCYISTCPLQPVVLLAAGTGFAQMKAIIEETFQNGCQQPVHLYWGARTPAGFYMPSLPVYWASEKGVHYHPVVSEYDTSTASDWEGRHGLLYKAVLEDIDQLMDAQFYISGSPEMVYATFDAFVAAGIAETQIHSDVFAYCPRPQK